MSGHSKWNSIKHKKAATDAKRGKVFTKVIRELFAAARQGGGNPDANPRLRTAMQTAKSVNMPRDTMEKAIKKGTGELPGITYEDITYEGYGPAGVAVFLEASTDNKNRTTAAIRHLFSKYGGNLGENGCVAWMFTKKGMILVDGEGVNEDALMEVVLEGGGEDFVNDGDLFSISVEPQHLEAMRTALESAGYKIQSAEVIMSPNNTVKLEGKEAESMLKLMFALEDQDDVQNVSANFDIADELIEQFSAS